MNLLNPLESSWLLRNRLPLVGRWLRRSTARALTADDSPDGIRKLAEAIIEGIDPGLEPILAAALSRSRDSVAVSVVADLWLRSENAALGKCLVDSAALPGQPARARLFMALKSGRIDQIWERTEQQAEALWEALCQDWDPEISWAADAFLGRIGDPDLIRTSCLHWSTTRDPAWARFLVRHGWVADQPPRLRALTALRTNRIHQMGPEAHTLFPELLSILREDPETELRENAEGFLRSLPAGPAQDGVIREFLQTGDPLLWRIIEAGGFDPSDPVLRLTIGLQRGASVDFEGLDPALLTDELIDLICQVWAKSGEPSLEKAIAANGWIAREPEEVRALSALLCGRLDLLPLDAPDTTDLLCRALSHPSPELSAHAAMALRETSAPEATDFICRRWAESRDPVLASIIRERGLVATAPASLVLLTALQAHAANRLAQADAVSVDLLFEIHSVDPDEHIRQGALTALTTLRQPASREKVCRRYIDRKCPVARNVALAGGHLPREELQRARFLILTGQWETYDDFDFDLTLARRAYLESDPEMQGRLMDSIRKGGRPDLMQAVLGLARDEVQVDELSARDLELLTRTLLERQAWNNLWRLVFRAPLIWSFGVLPRILEAGWLPASEAERQVLASLAGILAANSTFDPGRLLKMIPMAIRRAEARVEGNVNAVAFSPDLPVIAIGTGQRKLVRWNFRSGQVEQVWDGFRHSIGKVAFGGNGTVYAAERTNNPGTRCLIYRCTGKHAPHPIGGHDGSVTGLEVGPGGSVYSSGRDGKVVLWDPASGRPHRVRQLTDWPRFLRISPSGDRVLLCHEGATILDRDLEKVATFPWLDGIARCATFSGIENGVIAGKVNGQILAIHPGKRQPAGSIYSHAHEVTGLATLTRRRVLVCGWADGNVVFDLLPNLDRMGRCREKGSRMTSLHVSPDDAFMVLGDSDHHISFWDIRGLEVAELISKPLGRALPRDLAATSSFKDSSGVPAEARPALRFLEILLRHRFRYDIEISEPVIRAGKYDIHLTDAPASRELPGIPQTIS